MHDPKTNALIQHLSSAFTSIPFNRMLGLRLDALDATHAVMNFDMKEDLIGNYMQGILHGGVISSVLDMAGGMVTMAQVITRYPDKPPQELAGIIGKTSTIDLHINYVSPGRGSIFIAKAFLIRAGSHIVFTRMELFNDDETLIATANGTYLVR